MARDAPFRRRASDAFEQPAHIAISLTKKRGSVAKMRGAEGIGAMTFRLSRFKLTRDSRLPLNL
jgi:hypothetical protein